VDTRTGQWVRGFEGAYRDHNRYGYKTRVELKQQKKKTERDLRQQLQAAKGKGEDLRHHLNRSRASSEERMGTDCRQMREAIRRRNAQRGSPPKPLVTRGGVHSETNRRKASREGRPRNRDQGGYASHRTSARDRSRSPRRDAAANTGPGARDIYRQEKARQEARDENHDRRAILEEEKIRDEERRTLWIEEELRRTALLEEEEERHRKRQEEDETSRKKQGEEDEERRRLFLTEISDVRETIGEMLQEKIQEALKDIAPSLQSILRKSSE